MTLCLFQNLAYLHALQALCGTTKTGFNCIFIYRQIDIGKDIDFI